MKNQIQQGDVLFKRIKFIPEGAKKLGHKVIASGEATGHAHTLAQDTSATIWEINGVIYLDATDSIIIQHQEHKAVTIPRGVWEIGRVQEYDYIEEMAKRVVD